MTTTAEAAAAEATAAATTAATRAMTMTTGRMRIGQGRTENDVAAYSKGR